MLIHFVLQFHDFLFAFFLVLEYRPKLTFELLECRLFLDEVKQIVQGLVNLVLLVTGFTEVAFEIRGGNSWCGGRLRLLGILQLAPGFVQERFDLGQVFAADSLQLLPDGADTLADFGLGQLVVLEHFFDLRQFAAEALIFLAANARLNVLLNLLGFGQLDKVLGPKFAGRPPLLLGADDGIDGTLLHVAQVEELLLDQDFLLVEHGCQSGLADDFQLDFMTLAGLRESDHIVEILGARLNHQRFALDSQFPQWPAPSNQKLLGPKVQRGGRQGRAAGKRPERRRSELGQSKFRPWRDRKKALASARYRANGRACPCGGIREKQCARPKTSSTANICNVISALARTL